MGLTLYFCQRWLRDLLVWGIFSAQSQHCLLSLRWWCVERNANLTS